MLLPSIKCGLTEEREPTSPDTDRTIINVQDNERKESKRKEMKRKQGWDEGTQCWSAF